MTAFGMAGTERGNSQTIGVPRRSLRLRSGNLGIVLALLIATAGCTDERASEEMIDVPPGSIVFTRVATERGRPSLYTMRADGSRVTLFLADGANAAVSPNGRQIAFERGGGIWLSDRRGGNQRRLTHPPATEDHDPAWAPDGRTVYFTRGWPDPTWAIYAIRPDGSVLRRVTPGARGECEGGQGDTAPSPAGGLVAYTEYCYSAGDSSQLAAMTPNGRAAALPFLLPKHADFAEAPAWSPDAGRLAYVAIDTAATSGGVVGGMSGLYVSSGRVRPRRIVRGEVAAPSWSPGGRWIAFERGGDIWVTRADGSGARRIQETRHLESDAAWIAAG